ncbi:Auxin-repressed [Musa troglodytarum]|uniref:Auxin-repressed n=1 Tax=Musa troglodytarum TaxID=320322 RepID=A0A9E7GK06_9LILI|nr:Auxin-repressed [Musa troglodytarum]
MSLSETNTTLSSAITTEPPKSPLLLWKHSNTNSNRHASPWSPLCLPAKAQMGLLDQLWDDTVAGPPPVGKLRKYNSFSPSSSAAASATAAAAAAGGVVQVTRSITILRTASSSAATAPRSPSSPASAPDSPLARKLLLLFPLSLLEVSRAELTRTSFSPLFELLLWQRRGRGDWKRLRRKPVPVAEGTETAEPRSPTVYDWVVISSLDR